MNLNLSINVFIKRGFYLFTIVKLERKLFIYYSVPEMNTIYLLQCTWNAHYLFITEYIEWKLFLYFSLSGMKLFIHCSVSGMKTAIII